MKFFNFKKIFLAVLCLSIITILTSCVGARTLMMTASQNPKNIMATPAIDTPSIANWDVQRVKFQDVFEHDVYGVMPKINIVDILSTKTIDNEYLRGNIEEITLQSSYFTHDKDEIFIEFKAVILTPENVNSKTPIIMMENFCPNHNVIPLKAISKPIGPAISCDGTGWMAKIFGYFFGRYITTPPIQTILDKGYSIAVIFPSSVFPDRVSSLPLYKKAPDTSARWGAIGAWAWQFSLLSKHLDNDGRFSNTIAYGHSRYGKSALVAAAFNDTIDAAIAHQSGTGGASLSKDKPGETVSQITTQYPHWFTPAFREDNQTIDQHHLLALIAPRPILLGNARRDVWSDPDGAFRAAQAATSIYKLYGKNGLIQTKLTEFMPDADIAFWMRPGTHGVVKEDWPAFLAFLDAHFAP